MSGASKLSGSFTVEFGDMHGRQHYVQTLRSKFRGCWSLTNLHRRTDHEGKSMGGRPVGDAMSQMPDSPGQRLTVDLATGHLREYDPLESDPERLAHICRVMGRARGGVDVKYKPIPAKDHKIDEHTLKTLCRELYSMVNADDPKARVVDGKLPSQEQIKSMPGRFLFDPANSDPVKFRFEDQYEKWLENKQTANSA